MAVELDPQELETLARAFDRQQTRRGANSVASLELESKRQQQRIHAAFRDMAELQAKARELQDRIAAVQARGEDLTDAQTMIRRVLSLPEVLGAEVSRYGLEIETDHIVTAVLADGTQRWLGRFRILFGFDHGVHVMALDKDVVKDPKMTADHFYAYEHPHVFPSQRYPYPHENVCWGNIGRDVRQFLEAGAFDGAAALTLQFLNRYTEGKNYSIESWRVWVPPAPKVEKAAGGGAVREEEVLDNAGRLAGYQVVPLQGEHVAPRARTMQFRWAVQACEGKLYDADGVRDGRARCTLCGMDVAVTPRYQQLVAHGVRVIEREAVLG